MCVLKWNCWVVRQLHFILRRLHTIVHYYCTIYTVHKILLFPQPLQHLWWPLTFYDIHSNRYDVIFHGGLICISLVISDIEHHPIYLLPFSMSPLKSNICSIVNWVLFLKLSVWVSYIFWIFPFIKMMVCKYFLPFHRLLFYWLLNRSIWVWYGITYLILSFVICTLDISWENNSNANVKEFFSYVFRNYV